MSRVKGSAATTAKVKCSGAPPRASKAASFSTITVDLRASVAIVTLARPDMHNALMPQRLQRHSLPDETDDPELLRRALRSDFGPNMG